MITEAEEVENFQKKIESCAAFESYMTVYLTMVLALLVVLAL
jgi:hypothetical protein